MDRNPPPSSPRARLARLALAGMLAAGCSQPGPLTRRLATVDNLKTDVAQLETEKEQLRREVAESQKENRRVAAQLAEVEDENSELATRLNDARAVITRQGLDSDKFSPPQRTASEDRTTAPRRSVPAGSAKPKGRKVPLAEIPRDRRANADDAELPEPIEAPGPSRRESDPFGSQGSNAGASPWLPVARGDLGRPLR